MKITRLFYLFALLFVGLQSQGQTVNSFKMDTAHRDTPVKAKVRFTFGLDARRSFLLDQNASIGGMKIGFEIDDADRFGWGFYNLRNAAVLPDVPMLFTSADSMSSYVDTVDVSFNFSYNTLYYERVIFKNRKWEFATPFHIGGGRINATALDTNGIAQTFLDVRVIPMELSITGEYKIFRWFAVGAGLGYRAILTNDVQVQEAYNAPIYIVRAKVMFGELYRSVFKKEKKSDGGNSEFEEQ